MGVGLATAGALVYGCGCIVGGCSVLVRCRRVIDGGRRDGIRVGVGGQAVRVGG